MLKGITRNVWILAFVSLLTDVSTEMLYPLIPIFLSTVLAAPATVIGLIEGIAESTAAFLKVISGWISDRVGKRRFLVILGYGASAVGKPLLAIAFSWPTALFARFVDRFGKGIRTAPRDALIAESTPKEVRGAAFGLHRSLDTAGAVIGPLIALIILSSLGGDFRLVFALAFIPALLGVILLLLVKEVKRVMPIEKPLPFVLSFRGLPRNYKIFLAATAIFALGNSTDAFLLLRASEAGFSTTLVVLAYVVYNLTYSLSSLPAGAISDRIGRLRIVVTGLAIFSVVYLGFAFASEGVHFWLLFGIYGLYMGMTDGVGKAYVADLVPEERRGTLLGLYHTTLSILTFAASLTGGLLWDLVDPAATFVFGAVLAALAAAVLLFFRPKRIIEA